MGFDPPFVGLKSHRPTSPVLAVSNPNNSSYALIKYGFYVYLYLYFMCVFVKKNFLATFIDPKKYY